MAPGRWFGVRVGLVALAAGCGRIAFDPLTEDTEASRVQIALAWKHGCARLPTGRVRCWGQNDRGQLGDGTQARRTTTVDVIDLDDAIDITASDDATCARRASGEVVCWGDTPLGRSSRPVRVDGVDGAAEIAIGWGYACARLPTGEVGCWGEGLGVGNGTGIHHELPFIVPGVADAVSITASLDHACAVHATGRVTCWGVDAGGALGRGFPDDDNYGPGEVVDLTDAVEVTSGFFHTCARRASGRVVCWGNNDFGQLGNGELGPESFRPVDVGGIDNALTITAGSGHSCATLTTGQVACWGANERSQLGLGTNAFYQAPPVPVLGVTTASHVVGDEQATCAATSSGPVCWGLNRFGKLGPAVQLWRATPQRANGLDGAVALRAGGETSCGLGGDGIARCAGALTVSSSPVPVTGLGAVSDIVVSAGHACATTPDERAVCWGFNWWGQLGDDTTTHRASPALFGNLTSVSQVAVGSRLTCARLSDGSVYCAGGGALGDGTSMRSSTPVRVALASASSIAVGGDHACARLDDGSVWCWGSNFAGQLGDDSMTARSSPVQALGPGSATAVSAGSQHTCAIRTNGAVACWGRGPLGDGTMTTRTVPVDVNLMAPAVELALAHHSCARLTTGAVACWGMPLAPGAMSFGLTPQEIWPDGATALSAGVAHSCAIRNGQGWCWGGDENGQLGINSPIYFREPTPVPL